VQLTFGERGEIVRVYTPERRRDVNGESVPTAWAGYHRDYTQFHGMRVPLREEVEWVLPEGRLAYCRLQIRDIEYGSDRKLYDHGSRIPP